MRISFTLCAIAVACTLSACGGGSSGGGGFFGGLPATPTTPTPPATPDAGAGAAPVKSCAP